MIFSEELKKAFPNKYSWEQGANLKKWLGGILHSRTNFLIFHLSWWGMMIAGDSAISRVSNFWPWPWRRYICTDNIVYSCQQLSLSALLRCNNSDCDCWQLTMVIGWCSLNFAVESLCSGYIFDGVVAEFLKWRYVNPPSILGLQDNSFTLKIIVQHYWSDCVIFIYLISIYLIFIRP